MVPSTVPPDAPYSSQCSVSAHGFLDDEMCTPPPACSKVCVCCRAVAGLLLKCIALCKMLFWFDPPVGRPVQGEPVPDGKVAGVRAEAARDGGEGGRHRRPQQGEGRHDGRSLQGVLSEPIAPSEYGHLAKRNEGGGGRILTSARCQVDVQATRPNGPKKLGERGSVA